MDEILENNNQGEFKPDFDPKHFKTATIGEGGTTVIYGIPNDSLFYDYLLVRKMYGYWICYTQSNYKDKIDIIATTIVDSGEEAFVIATSLLVIIKE